MPIDDIPLVVEPTYPHAEFLSGLNREAKEEKDEGDLWRIVNSWWDVRKRCDILIIEREGKRTWTWRPAVHSGLQQLNTLGASDVWGIEQEGNAVQLLGTMLRHRQFKQYLLTGMFLEHSPRSGVTYLFRKLRPTVALRPGRTDEESMRILACLCMHPIAYYRNSWAGAMCPTDDVIAHLAMMRGDEAMFWKRCNQHPAHRPEAGL